MKKLMKKVVCAFVALTMMMTLCVTSFADLVTIENGKDAKNGVVYIESWCGNDGCAGTGFAIGDPTKPVKYIATNWHVVTCSGSWSPNNARVRVYLTRNSSESNFLTCKVVAIGDKNTDLAVLELPREITDRTALKLCPSATVETGEKVMTIGFPGDADRVTNHHSYGIQDVTMTDGIIQKKTTYKLSNNINVYETTASINHGNSGGPLVSDETGAVLGINTWGFQSGSDSREFYLSIMVDELINLIDKNGLKAKVGYVLTTDQAPSQPDSTPSQPESDPEAPADSTQEEASSEAASEAESEDDEEDSNNMWLIIGIAAAVVVAAVVVVVVLNKKKKPAPKQEPAPVQRTSYVPPQQTTTQTRTQTQVQAPAPASNATLICEKGALVGRSYTVSSSIIIGRDPQKCTVCFPVDTKGVSGVHCEIRRSSKGYEIIDRGSSYGTTLGNGQKLTANVPVYIPSGSYFSVGSMEQMFQIKY